MCVFFQKTALFSHLIKIFMRSPRHIAMYFNKLHVFGRGIVENGGCKKGIFASYTFDKILYGLFDAIFPASRKIFWLFGRSFLTNMISEGVFKQRINILQCAGCVESARCPEQSCPFPFPASRKIPVSGTCFAFSRTRIFVFKYQPGNKTF